MYTKKSEKIIRIYAGFYQFIGALVEYCLFYGLIVTSHDLEFKQVPSVCSVVCLFDYVHWTLLSYKEATNLIKKKEVSTAVL